MLSSAIISVLSSAIEKQQSAYPVLRNRTMLTLPSLAFYASSMERWFPLLLLRFFHGHVFARTLPKRDPRFVRSPAVTLFLDFKWDWPEATVARMGRTGTTLGLDCCIVHECSKFVVDRLAITGNARTYVVPDGEFRPSAMKRGCRYITRIPVWEYRLTYCRNW